MPLYIQVDQWESDLAETTKQHVTLGQTGIQELFADDH